MLPDETAAGDARHDCTSCPVATRRAFLRDALVAVGGIAASLGIARTAAALPFDAFPVSTTTPLVGGERGARTRAYGLPAADGAQIDKENEVILVRWQGSVYAFNLSCPHQNTALKWDAGDHQFQCPKHHSKYQPDGTFIEGRATRGMDRLGIQRVGPNVVVDLDRLYQEDENPAEWKAAVVKL